MIRRHDTILTEAAPAKVNLALHLRHKRADGYHALETVFAFTAFGDELTARPADTISLALSGEFAGAAGPDADNLVLRAAHALAAAAGVTEGAEIALDKRIPVAAGLGGGSADAAATLRLLSRLWGLDWSLERLDAIAATLGSDVPACVHSRLCFGAGRGEVLAPWPDDLSGTPVLLVNPRVAVPTGPVFAGWDRVDHGGIAAGAPLATLRNDMTAAACALAPVIGEVLAALAATGPMLSRMSGSGATCLALYHDNAARDRAAAAIAPHGWWQVATHLI
ncbi:4-(cytidine 5'-diphospho)-2-C-methyl-D-erythritol kinase [Polymorphobacter fuscus]|uniref:4-diphosphocytidyl-2-C-methyl-D-erythritol kinase n=1 Tax=Sandarakinorhabdus fusca TaxID=1439888 RepID=A0A7C9KJR6_9SPHN|nr:4-(cytidine 5'-diphospho)-2-C-methyl-D-erythritol kinase [Polymorphobacter fuscus]KAB7648478.1 4-(cytidine 5'-diphospho)-2-C-methyl-D-erythritol kinase [Polymorphobacter fuscus]MQT16003.1 4-(cytidine 5'-diphospho)-2-C-methyl-D-erythritol kinase [Polymorphobacter fuscus]NJC07720.1 4-diphosphocytidyl-2-C-methyl-D-erythritol kinase [Polymorphobacter fuscus]